MRNLPCLRILALRGVELARGAITHTGAAGDRRWPLSASEKAGSGSPPSTPRLRIDSGGQPPDPRSFDSAALAQDRLRGSAPLDSPFSSALLTPSTVFAVVYEFPAVAVTHFIDVSGDAFEDEGVVGGAEDCAVILFEDLD